MVRMGWTKNRLAGSAAQQKAQIGKAEEFGGEKIGADPQDHQSKGTRDAHDEGTPQRMDEHFAQ